MQVVYGKSCSGLCYTLFHNIVWLLALLGDLTGRWLEIVSPVKFLWTSFSWVRRRAPSVSRFESLVLPSFFQDLGSSLQKDSHVLYLNIMIKFLSKIRKKVNYLYNFRHIVNNAWYKRRTDYRGTKEKRTLWGRERRNIRTNRIRFTTKVFIQRAGYHHGERWQPYLWMLMCLC